MRSINIIVAFIAVALTVMDADRVSAQNHEERRLVREGNREFNNKEYAGSLERYNAALEVDPDCMEAKYNRANAYHHVARKNSGLEVEKRDTAISWERSNAHYEELLKDSRLSGAQRAEVYRNIGESLMRQQQHEAALNAFRESLVLNADDQETKRNYVLAKRIVDQKRQQNQNNQDQNQDQDQNNQGGGNGQDDQNQDQDQNQDKNNQDGGGDQDKDKNKDQDRDQGQGDGDGDDKRDDKGDNNNDSKNGDGDQEEESGDGNQDGNQGGDEQEQPSGLSDEQERLLDAVQGEEDKTQDKVNKNKAAVYVRGKKNW